MVLRSAAVLLVGVLGPVSVARAENLLEQEAAPQDAYTAADASTFTPGIARAEATNQGFAFAATTFNTAADSTNLDVFGEVRVWKDLHLVLRADDITHTGRPGIGAAYQFLSEKKDGVATTAYLTYKTEGFTEIEGEIEAAVAIGKQFGPIRGVVNLAYGQDADAKERDGEVAVDAHTTLIPNRLIGGVVGRYRDALGSGGDRGVLRDMFGGAASTVGIGPLGVTAMAGFAGFEDSATKTFSTGFQGTIAIGGGF